jgi:hypothetical protein
MVTDEKGFVVWSFWYAASDTLRDVAISDAVGGAEGKVIGVVVVVVVGDGGGVVHDTTTG